MHEYRQLCCSRKWRRNHSSRSGVDRKYEKELDIEAETIELTKESKECGWQSE